MGCEDQRLYGRPQGPARSSGVGPVAGGIDAERATGFLILMRGHNAMQDFAGPSRIPECVSRVPARSTERDFKEGCDRVMIVPARGSVRGLKSAGTQGGHHGGSRLAAES